MIIPIKKLKTRIAIIHQIPKKFFKNLEASSHFGDHLFPSWIDVFDATDLKKKFKEVYDLYKNIPNIRERQKITTAFIHSNDIYKLCANDPNSILTPIDQLGNNQIRTNVSNLFIYLYNSCITYWKFEQYIKDTKKAALLRYKENNRIMTCPYCGLEGIDIIEGQFTPALDHWLPKSVFPMCAVNFHNLVPIGEACNRSPAKGTKIVLYKNFKDGERTIAFHPYINHQGINTKFEFVKEPESIYLKADDWKFSFQVNDKNDTAIFDSWDSVFNIKIRYNDYFEKTIFPMWLGLFDDFLRDEGLVHANNINELKENLRKFKSTFQIKQRPGSILYRDFIDFLLTKASDSYLYGIGKNLDPSFMPEIDC